MWNWIPDLEAGSWADWVAGGATTIAVIIALMQIAIERSHLRRQDLTSYAKLVSAWVVSREMATRTIAKDSLDELKIDLPHDFVYINNASDAAIYNVVVAVIESSDEITVKDLHGRTDLEVVLVVPPGLHRFETGWSSSASTSEHPPSVAFTFRDGQGAIWLRSNKGTLIEHSKRRSFNMYAEATARQIMAV